MFADRQEYRPYDLPDLRSTAPYFQADCTYQHREEGTSSKKARKKCLSRDELERRRSVANHQERRRMHRLNSALDLLRSVIPSRFQNGNHRRLSKIKTLKMAILYISELQRLLGP